MIISNRFTHNSLRSVIGIVLLTLFSACSTEVDTSDLSTLSSLTFAAIPGDDAPELAHLGAYRVGVQTKAFVFENQQDVALLNYIAGEAPRVDRQLSIDILYPAQVSANTPANAIYNGYYETGLSEIKGLPDSFEIKGIAVRDAQVLLGTRFPLVIVSHGLLNTPGVLSGLTENLASKGYIVAVIDHGDRASGSDSPLHGFARVMLNRSLDQQRVLAQILTLASEDKSGLGAIIDTESIGIMGYSMGGYGVLNHAGAGYNPDGDAYDSVPGDLLQSQSENDTAFQAINRDHIDAAITLAPWGAQPEAGIFTDSALANITAPLLVLAGSEDDISKFNTGIKRVFEKTAGSDRHMLVFQNALHNIAQVPAPASAHLDIVPWQTFEDPTWRRERLLAVASHFITAFFDWHLKGDKSRASYFDLPTVKSNDASWEQSMLSNTSDEYADGTDESAGYWQGFKPRQALGLEMHRLAAGETR